jgi:hypothetical protein
MLMRLQPLIRHGRMKWFSTATRGNSNSGSVVVAGDSHSSSEHETCGKFSVGLLFTPRGGTGANKQSTRQCQGDLLPPFHSLIVTKRAEKARTVFVFHSPRPLFDAPGSRPAPEPVPAHTGCPMSLPCRPGRPYPSSRASGRLKSALAVQNVAATCGSTIATEKPGCIATTGGAAISRRRPRLCSRGSTA